MKFLPQVKRILERRNNLWTDIGKIWKNTYYSYSPEPAQPLNRQPVWTCAEEAIQCVTSCDTVFVGGGLATPVVLLKAMTCHAKAKNLNNVTVCHLGTECEAPYTFPEASCNFFTVAFYVSQNMVKPVCEGLADTVPIHYGDIPLLFNRKLFIPDVSLIQVSPPDNHGYCSLGTSVDCVRAALMHSKIIVAQVNHNMPRTFGDAVIHQSHLDYAVCINEQLPTEAEKCPTDTQMYIGKHIADHLIDNCATLQIGPGPIGDALMYELRGHRDLGIHTDVLTVNDRFIDLVKCCALTNNKKPINQGKIIASTVIGSPRVFEFLNNNPLVEMKVSNYTNASRIIALHPKMTSVNTAFAMDLTGQLNADSDGTTMKNGFGGFVDFCRGAALGFDCQGKSIIALESLNDCNQSSIVDVLKPGAGVVLPRANVDYVVTECGIASLFGKSFRQRAYELINIANPKYRECLEKQAYDRLKVMPSP